MNNKIEISKNIETGEYTIIYNKHGRRSLTFGNTPEEVADRFLKSLNIVSLASAYLNTISGKKLQIPPFFHYNEVCHQLGLPSKISDKLMDTMEIVFIKDEFGDGGTIYFQEIPGIIAEGDTLEEARKNLYELTKFHFSNP